MCTNAHSSHKSFLPENDLVVRHTRCLCVHCSGIFVWYCVRFLISDFMLWCFSIKVWCKIFDGTQLIQTLFDFSHNCYTFHVGKHLFVLNWISKWWSIYSFWPLLLFFVIIKADRWFTLFYNILWWQIPLIFFPGCTGIVPWQWNNFSPRSGSILCIKIEFSFFVIRVHSFFVTKVTIFPPLFLWNFQFAMHFSVISFDLAACFFRIKHSFLKTFFISLGFLLHKLFVRELLVHIC